ncbi:hypothetical protein RhiirA5_435837, partial [Rhizophagus irregularis]
ERLENSLEGPWETPGKPQKDLGTVLEDLRKKLENGLGGPQEMTWERSWRPRGIALEKLLLMQCYE